jgi:hypothetical protein
MDFRKAAEHWRIVMPLVDENGRNRIDALVAAIAPERRKLIAHPVYTRIRSADHLRIFMQHHVFPVWDFMSLLKALQAGLSCVSVPWVPVGDPNTRRLINDIVMTEETDEDGLGGFISHFELYLEAMREVDADTAPIDDFIARIVRGEDLTSALDGCSAPHGSREFVRSTFGVIDSGQLHRIAACFTFCREDIVPDMFKRLVAEMRKRKRSRLDRFIYYLDRHIEVDTDAHGPMALKMVEAVCGDSAAKWREAEETAIYGIRCRLSFWDAVVEEILRHDGKG